MKVKYSANARIGKKDLPSVVKKLKEIERNTGVLTPAVVVSEAASPKSVLHKFFTWNNTAAAEKWREFQARKLIQSVNVLFTDSHGKVQSVRAFVNLKPDLNPDEEDDFALPNQGYVSVSRTAKGGGFQRQVLEYARTQLLIWRKKFGGYQEFFEVCEVIDKLR